MSNIVAAPRFALNPALDRDALAARFAQEGRLRIRDFLDHDCAEALHHMLRGREDWLQLLNSGETLVELGRDVRAGLSDEQRRALSDAVYAGARYGFQYRYESIRVPDDAPARRHSDDPLAAFARWLSEGEARTFLRGVTGAADIAFADAQATAYSPGDFLTGHDDAFVGKQRRAAYVFGLTPSWRTEWGGLLLFHDPASGDVAGLTPSFNTLDLFAVPQMHSVSEVSAAAAFRRYSITGWLRAGAA